MLRVAVLGADTAEWTVLAARVRHACLERWEGWEHPSGASAQAVACVGDPRLHGTVVEAALAGGRHVLLVTPTMPEVSTLERWLGLAESQRVRLEVVNPQLARPSRRLIRQQIDNGKLGEVGLIRISRGVFLAAPGGGSIPPRPLSAAVLADIDVAVWLTGHVPERVYAIHRRCESAESRDRECLHVHLGFATGSSALIVATTVAAPGDESESLSVIARCGAAYADDHHNRQLLLGGGMATAPRALEWDALATLLDEFAARVPGEFDAAIELRRWRQLASISAALGQSSEMQQAIALELN